MVFFYPVSYRRLYNSFHSEDNLPVKTYYTMKQSNIRSKQLILLLFFVTGILSAHADNRKWMNPKLPPETRAKLLMKAMTIDEKIAQMEMVSLWDEKKVIEEERMHLGAGVGAWIAEISPEAYNRLQAYSELSRLQIPYLIGNDAAHGDAMKQGRTVFPSSITMAATFNPELVGRAAQLAAAEIRASGNHWTFAPSIDIVHDARWGRTGETYGEDPLLSSILVTEAVKGLQGNYDPQKNVAACAKHFLGGGASLGGVNHGHAELSERTLRTDFLPPFKAAIDAGVATIMPGHNDVNGIPVHASHELLTQLVKEDYGFKGFFISDMGDVENLLNTRLHRTAGTQKEAVRQAVCAGLDMHMYGWDKQMFLGNLRQLYDENQVTRQRIDDAVLRILTLKFRLGLFENRYIDTSRLQQTLRKPAALKTALQAARESIVLLTNRDQLLPLDTTRYRHILVTGPNADNQAMLGDWAAPQEKCEHVVTLLDGIRKEFPHAQITYIPVGRIKGTRSKTTVATTDPVTQAKALEEGGEINDYAIRQAAEAASKADLTILAIGGYGLRTDWGLRTYGESADRPSIDFYGRQVELAKAIAATGKPFITVINNGKPLNNNWVKEHSAAIIDAWEPGMFGGQAVAEVISGRINPSGQLPITIPQHAGQVPLFYYQTKARYLTGYGLGSTRADDKPAFCFGHGLSYTSFRCRDLNATDTLLVRDKSLQVKVELTNTGAREGARTVMVFVRDNVSSVTTALQRLAAFRKVTLKAGESTPVTLEVPADAFKLWNREMKQVAEPGTFTLMVGTSVDDIHFSRTVTLPE